VLIGPDAMVVDIIQRLLPTQYQRILEAAAKQRVKKMGGLDIA
jgi:hypothetical protein